MKKTLLLIIPAIFTSLIFSQLKEEIVERHPNGVKKLIIVYEGRGSKEKLVRKLEYYDNEKILSSADWKDGKLDGKWILYHDNGQIHNEGNYKDGLKDGKWTDYWENGQISSVRNFKDGKLVE